MTKKKNTITISESDIKSMVKNVISQLPTTKVSGFV